MDVCGSASAPVSSYAASNARSPSRLAACTRTPSEASAGSASATTPAPSQKPRSPSRRRSPRVGADLHVRAVVDDRVPSLAQSALSGLVEVEWNELISTEMNEIRAQAVAAGERIGAQLDVEVARGRPANLLLELSEGVDLLVIGSRDWGPAARLLLGSTGEALMHDAACAVLAVPRPSS